MVEHFKKYFLVYTVIPLLILLAASSYYRFMVTHDYIVSYEGECDPVTENCFVDCEDEECTADYYYTIVERHSVEIFNICGDDITDCEEANACPANSETCSVIYCDIELDGEACETFDETSNFEI